MTTNISIYLSYHKNCARLMSTILKPIHVGRALASPEVKKSLIDICGDDSGDNISNKNASYCELTAQYWVWKNDKKSDYLGFLHYRRHLDFNLGNTDQKDKWGVINEECITKDYVFRRGLFDSNIEKIVTQYDIVTISPWDVRNAGSKNNYDHYQHSDPKLHIKDYDKALEILRRKFPQYSRSVDEYNNSKLGYYTNIFVMKRGLFNEYSNFLFSILFELEKTLDLSQYNKEERRVFGYISEWLFGIFLTYQKQKTDVKILELNRTFIKQPEIQEKGDIHICTACDDKYAEYLATCITSVLKNKNRDDKIYYYVLDGGISEASKQKLRSFTQYGRDYYIYFLPIDNSKFGKLSQTIQSTHLSLATYYRLLITDVLPDFLDRVIYLDGDTIVRSSLSGLYNHDMSCAVLGIKDVLEEANTKRLHLRQYVNAGVLLINLTKWREQNVKEKFAQFIEHHFDKIFYYDQDVINCVLQDEIQQINPLWNAQTASYPGSEEQNENGKTAFIVHYVSDRKPWIEGNGNPFEGEWISYWKLSPWGSRKFKYVSDRKGEKKSLRDKPYYPACVKIVNLFLPFYFKMKLKKFLGLN